MNKIELTPIKEAKFLNLQNQIKSNHKQLLSNKKKFPINSLECVSETKYDIIYNQKTKYINQNINIGLLNEMQKTYNKVNSEIYDYKKISINTTNNFFDFSNKKRYADRFLSFKNKKTINHSNNDNKKEIRGPKLQNTDKNYYRDIPLTFFFTRK